MCGIAGAFDFGGGSLPRDCGTPLRHRGPDAGGSLDVGVGRLWHRRLAVIDLTEAGAQPMSVRDGHLSLVYNGEIYNFAALRSELEALGETFSGGSDSEVLLRGFAVWGADVLPRLEGMFAFAIWDGRAKELHLARDRFGIKPLFTMRQGKRFGFGSEIKALVATGWLEPVLNWQALAEYLHYGSALGEESFYEGVQEIEPGGHWIVGEQGIRRRRYVAPQELGTFRGTEAEATEELRTRLAAAVQSHLVSDVPIGIFLSGGVDSSAVAAYAARQEGQALCAFSARFDFLPDGDELARAQRFSRALGLRHEIVPVHADSLPRVLDHIVAAHDQPFGDPASIPLYLLCAEVGGSVKVVLQGDGGDEVFGGYPRYSRLAHLGFFRRLAWVWEALGPLLPGKSSAYRALRTTRAFREGDPGRRMAILLSQEAHTTAPMDFLRPAARDELERINPYRVYEHFAEKLDTEDPVEQMLEMDLNVILPHVYFRKTDRVSMAHGIEIRVPMVDSQLVTFVQSLPRTFKVRGWEKKRLLRAALRGVVPDEILDARKQGFGVPVDDWLRKPLRAYMEDKLLDPKSRFAELVDVDRLRLTMASHVEGRENRGLFLYKMLMLGIWLDRSGVRFP